MTRRRFLTLVCKYFCFFLLLFLSIYNLVKLFETNVLVVIDFYISLTNMRYDSILYLCEMTLSNDFRSPHGI